MYDRHLKTLLANQFPKADIAVSGGDRKYEVKITSERFRNLSAVKRHQLVYAAVTEEIKTGALHALTIVAQTPDE